MKLTWLNLDTPFPPADQALDDPPGLLAFGADLSVARLAQAYRQGIFPWYAPGEPILWWSMHPRMVLACADFAPSHSLRKRLRRIEAESAGPTPSVVVKVDTAFADVLTGCAAPRDNQNGTWIMPEMQHAYRAWHEAGSVHSIETWMDGKLAGGLYGVSLGRMFFGESMFARQTDASKIALAYLVAFLRANGVAWIDCQQETRHLASLGARPVDRAQFIRHLARTVDEPAPPWRPGILNLAGELKPL
ncbi:leucyl/phenylalanyl-tRNA--protein transferase [Bordetella sp. FB-8]|uniref:leucyl/phenylalanyl-tRNA--protein transferase n=1 Tax=Bordetella sp. FB-8 TaxID=1159870 RepID=UPI00037812B0|nr:leucyl/phenylalanyl-tRNA--protein transferase [Bordetella sp. FB-8]